MSRSEITEQKNIVLLTLTAIQQYPDYVSPSGDDEFDLEGVRMDTLVDYLENDMDNLKGLLLSNPNTNNPVTREDLEEVLTKEQLDNIEEILQHNRNVGDDDAEMRGGKRTTRRRKKTCKRGTIRRRAYTRKDGARVKSACIKDMGKPGKGKQLFTLKKGDLTKHGYSIKVGKERRQRALRKAKKHIPHATLIRKLNALAILFKNTKPHYAKRARADMEYLRNVRSHTQKRNK